jgi:hypothetical protein
MSTDQDHTERLLEQSLSRHAAEAPSDGRLLTTVHARLRRRRTTRTIGAALLACASIATAFAVAAGVGSPTPPPVAADNEWRWESYHGVEVQVPSTWDQGGDGSEACLQRKGSPTVSRSPWITTSQYCGEVAPLAYRSDTLKLSTRTKAGIRRWDNGWADETRVVNGVSVTVFSADAALRSRILGSIRAVGGTDSYGCWPHYPPGMVAAQLTRTGLGEVQRISVCSYLTDQRGGLYAARLFTGDAASQLAGAIAAAPQGSGPGNGPQCYRGDKLFALILHGTQSSRSVLVRYSGTCDNGIEDSGVSRRLTGDVLRPLLTGPDGSWSAPDEVGRLLR